MSANNEETIKALAKKDSSGVLSLEDWLKENAAMVQNPNKISPWLAVVIGVGSFFLGSLVIAVIFLGVYVISMNSHRYPERYRYDSERPYYGATIPRGAPAPAQIAPQVYRAPVQRPPATENAPTLNGTGGIPQQNPNVTEVPQDYIMLKPPTTTKKPVRTEQYPATPAPAPEEQANPYAAPPGVSLEQGH